MLMVSSNFDEKEEQNFLRLYKIFLVPVVVQTEMEGEGGGS